MNEQSAANLAAAKQGVEELLAKRTEEYEAEWKAKGGDPAPEEDEWHQITEAKDSEAADPEAADPEAGEGAINELVEEPSCGSDLIPGEVPGEVSLFLYDAWA